MRDLLLVGGALALFFASTFLLVQGSGLVPEAGIVAGLQALRGIDPVLMAGGVIGLLMVDLLVAVPTMTTILLAGWVLGPVAGGAVAAAGLMAMGGLAYGLGRWIGRPMLGRMMRDPARLAALEAAFARQDLLVLVLCQALPILPEVCAVLAGVSRMRPLRFVSGFGLGVVPYAFVMAWGGAASSPDNLRPAVLTAIGVTAGLLALWRLVLRRAGRAGG